uniref:Uncharacterized protein n=1 Tax=Romanomermis culicivorax TaxID=13658 RepID=A0A915IUS2_ROMCU
MADGVEVAERYCCCVGGVALFLHHLNLPAADCFDDEERFPVGGAVSDDVENPLVVEDPPGNSSPLADQFLISEKSYSTPVLKWFAVLQKIYDQEHALLVDISVKLRTKTPNNRANKLDVDRVEADAAAAAAADAAIDPKFD